MTEKVIVGGTFDHIHRGHEKLLNTALGRGEVTIGLVSDEMLKDWKPQVERDFEERKEQLEDHLYTKENWQIVKISDPYTEAVEGNFDTLVVSYETEERGRKLNEMRAEKGKEPLELVVVNPFLAEDFIPISSSRIREGEIDEMGNRMTPVQIQVGSRNGLKKEVTGDVFSRYFEAEVHLKAHENLVSQPFNEEILEGAKRRAEVPEGYDYGVGLESGIIETEDGPFSLEYAVIKDKNGRETSGHGPGFHIPDSWVGGLKEGLTLGKKIKMVFKDYDEERGAIGMLTDGETSRKECIKAALLTAMIPRLKNEIYY